MSAATPSPRPVWSASGAAARAGAVPQPQPVHNPAMRASTADRQRYADYLGQAYATGQLDDAELSTRLDAALNAKTLGELEPLAADLNFAGMTPAVPEAPAPAPAKAVVATTKKTHPVRRIVAGLVTVVVILTGVSIAGSAHESGFGGGYAGPGIGQDQHVRWGDQNTVLAGPASQLTDGLRVDVGSASVDATGVSVDAEATWQLRVGAGSATVTLPSDQNVRVEYDLAVGSVTATGPGTNTPTRIGVGAEGVYQHIVDPDGPVWTIIARLDAGSLTIVG